MVPFPSPSLAPWESRAVIVGNALCLRGAPGTGGGLALLLHQDSARLSTTPITNRTPPSLSHGSPPLPGNCAQFLQSAVYASLVNFCKQYQRQDNKLQKKKKRKKTKKRQVLVHVYSGVDGTAQAVCGAASAHTAGLCPALHSWICLSYKEEMSVCSMGGVQG